MPKLYETKFPNGDTLIRMRRAEPWRDCQEPDCFEQCFNQWGWSTPDGFIGWRSACSRKHAISIWQRELTVDFPPGSASASADNEDEQAREAS